MTLLILNVCVFTAVYYKLHSGKISSRHGNGGGANCRVNRKGSLNTSGLNVSNCGPSANYTTSTIERNRKGSITSSRSPGHSHSSLTTSSRHLAGQSQQLLAHTPTSTLVSHHGHHGRHHSHSYHLYSGAPTDDTGDEYDSDGGFINDAIRHGTGGGGGGGGNNNEYTVQSVGQITGQQQAKSQSNQPSVTFSEYVTQHTLPHSSDVTSSTSSSTMTGHLPHHSQSSLPPPPNSYSSHSGHSMHPSTATTTYFTSDHGQTVAMVGSNGVTTNVNGTIIGVSDVTSGLIYRPIYTDSSDVSDGGQCCPPVDPSQATTNHGAMYHHSHHQGTQQSLQSLSHQLSAVSSGHQQQPGQPGHALYHHNGHPGTLGNLHHSLQVSGGLLLAPCSSSSPISSSSLCSSSMSPGISSVGGGSSSVNGVNGGGGGGGNSSHNCQRVTSITGDLIGTGANPATCQAIKSGLNTSNATTTTATTTTSVDGKNCSLTVIQELEDEGHL